MIRSKYDTEESRKHEQKYRAFDRMMDLLPTTEYISLMLAWLERLRVLHVNKNLNWPGELRRKPYVVTDLMLEQTPKQKRRKAWGNNYTDIERIAKFIKEEQYND